MKYLQNKRVQVMSVLGMLSMMSASYATYYQLSDMRRMNCMLDKHDLAVVLFYNNQKAQECVKQDFKQLSRGYSYHEADVAFIGIDVAGAAGADIAREYGVMKTPTLLLFQDGYVVLGKDRTPVLATDIKSTADIRLFINTYFGDLIEDELREKEERDRRRGRRSRPSGFRFGISYGYQYYPYYGYPFGYQYGYPIIYW